MFTKIYNKMLFNLLKSPEDVKSTYFILILSQEIVAVFNFYFLVSISPCHFTQKEEGN